MGGGKRRHGKRKPGSGVGGAGTGSGDAAASFGVTLTCTQGFHNALADKECPAGEADRTTDDSGGCHMEWEGVDKALLPELLAWFEAGVAADPRAQLRFSSSLSKDDRAFVHRVVSSKFSPALETSSEGVGEERCIVVYAKGQAPKRQLSPEEVDKVTLLFKLTRDAYGPSHQLSRDEIADLVLTGQLPDELEALWRNNKGNAEESSEVADAINANEAGDPRYERHREFLRRGKLLTSGELPLAVAARLGHLQALRGLLAAGAPVDAKDGNGRTALQLSRTFEQCDAEAILLQHGAHDRTARLFPMSRAAAELAAAGSWASSSGHDGGQGGDGGESQEDELMHEEEQGDGHAGEEVEGSSSNGGEDVAGGLPNRRAGMRFIALVPPEDEIEEDEGVTGHLGPSVRKEDGKGGRGSGGGGGMTGVVGGTVGGEGTALGSAHEAAAAANGAAEQQQQQHEQQQQQQQATVSQEAAHQQQGHQQAKATSEPASVPSVPCEPQPPPPVANAPVQAATEPCASGPDAELAAGRECAASAVAAAQRAARSEATVRVATEGYRAGWQAAEEEASVRAAAEWAGRAKESAVRFWGRVAAAAGGEPASELQRQRRREDAARAAAQREGKEARAAAVWALAAAEAAELPVPRRHASQPPGIAEPALSLGPGQPSRAGPSTLPGGGGSSGPGAVADAPPRANAGVVGWVLGWARGVRGRVAAVAAVAAGTGACLLLTALLLAVGRAASQKGGGDVGGARK